MGIKETNEANVGQQHRECEHSYEFYIDSTEHTNTEGWRGMGSNDELNIYIYMYILYVVQLFTFLFKAAAAVATAAY
jgi:hypothetical protein